MNVWGQTPDGMGTDPEGGIREKGGGGKKYLGHLLEESILVKLGIWDCSNELGINRESNM